ncbi:MAG: N-acyl amino acid synthase FeeM domain-containing protein [Thermoguttaceae bacterium]
MPLIAVEIVYQTADPFLQEAELKIKRWLSRLPQGAASITVEKLKRLDWAHERARQATASDRSNTALVLSLGFGEEELDACGRLDDEGRIEVMCFRRSFDPPCLPSASLLDHGPIEIGSLAILESTLDKLRLRIQFKEQGVVFRSIDSGNEEELEQYFRLRYDVYKPLGYIPPEFDAPETRWEVHWSDRWSVPFGAFTPSNQLIACARLVSELGAANKYSTAIDRMVEQKGSDAEYPILKRCWETPLQIEHPFDLLAAFETFEDYYQVLVRNQVRKAEVSRVMRRPEWRGERLGEVMIDSLCGVAAQQQFDVLFLACREKHGQFYRQSGFEPVPGMECDRFGNFPVKAIAMWRWLGKPVDAVRRFLAQKKSGGAQ